jgi:RNA polymerase sigma factor (sigma-70 family)
MSEAEQDFKQLMQRVLAGSSDATRELLRRYGPHLLRIVRRKLHRNLRSKFDSLDFVQAVWASFFASDLRDYRFDRPEALAGFLANLARNKVVDAVRQRQTDKYNVNQEHSLDRSETRRAAGLAARQATPSQVAVANEQWDRWLQDLPPHYQRILVLLRQGSNHRQIAEELGVNEKTVRRLLSKLAGQSGS